MRDDIQLNDRARALQDQLIARLERIYDPDIELDIYNLGLIYKIELDDNGHCTVVMTFTDTACECAETLPLEVVASLKEIPEIQSVVVNITWSPAWKITRISRFGRIALGISPR